MERAIFASSPEPYGTTVVSVCRVCRRVIVRRGRCVSVLETIRIMCSTRTGMPARTLHSGRSISFRVVLSNVLANIDVILGRCLVIVVIVVVSCRVRKVLGGGT